MPIALCSFWTCNRDRTNSFRIELFVLEFSSFRKVLSSSGEYQEAFCACFSGSTTIVLVALSSKLTLLPVFLSPLVVEELFFIAAALQRDLRAMAISKLNVGNKNWK